MEDSAVVVSKLRSRRRQAIDTLWRRDLIIALVILFLFIAYLNLTHFGVIAMPTGVWPEILTFSIFFIVLGAGIGLVHYVSYRTLNERFVEEFEERIENQSGLFLTFALPLQGNEKEALGLETHLRLPNVTKIKKMEVTCIDDYVYLYFIHYGNKEKGLLIQTSTSGQTGDLLQLRNDIRVMALLNGEKPIKTYYPENVPELAQFVGFSTQSLGEEPFFNDARKAIATTLSAYEKHRFCLTKTDTSVTLFIDNFPFERGSHLYARLDLASFSRHLDLRSMIQTAVGIVIKTAHEQ